MPVVFSDLKKIPSGYNKWIGIYSPYPDLNGVVYYSTPNLSTESGCLRPGLKWLLAPSQGLSGPCGGDGAGLEQKIRLFERKAGIAYFFCRQKILELLYSKELPGLRAKVWGSSYTLTGQGVFAELAVVKVVVEAFGVHEFPVGSFFNYPAVIHYQYGMGIFYGAQSVGYDKAGSSFH
jgi:hypothetical protein